MGIDKELRPHDVVTHIYEDREETVLLNIAVTVKALCNSSQGDTI